VGDDNLSKSGFIDPFQSKIIACATVIEEIIPIMPDGLSCDVLDFGLHIRPGELLEKLQKIVDSLSSNIKTVILGYGLCSQAVVGLMAKHCTLVIPKVDDCISIFLGSRTKYRDENRNVPGTYYLTKGWLKTGGTPFHEYDNIVKRFGVEKARRIMNSMLQNYTRLAFINTGTIGLEEYRSQAEDIAKRFNLRYEEINGSDVIIKKMVYGPWDEDFLVVEPGHTISFLDFR
jgi:hypothetical protein